MPCGICIYAENINNRIEPVVNELVSAAHKIKEMTGEPIQVILAAENCSGLVKQLENLDIDQIYAVETKDICLFSDDSMSSVVSEMLKRVDPNYVLVPATAVGRSLFPRVAARLKTGLTADCTELIVETRENGSFYIKQNKPSFGERLMVTIIDKEEYYPQMMTIRPGVYIPYAENCSNKAQVTYFKDIATPGSKIEILAVLPVCSDVGSMISADIVVVGGKGVLEGDNLSLVNTFALKVGGVVGGTRPLADNGIIPFESQIGQTGCTIRPKICLSLGVSGAIQHTEGIKDTKLFIAVNSDKDAPIFKFADYGVVADMKDILPYLTELIEN